MAATSAQGRSPESERSVTRPDESQSRELSKRGAYPSFSPFSIMRRLSEEMDRAFGNSFGLFRDRGEEGLWAPPIELRERDGSLEISAELPGMKKENIKVECTDEGLIIEGEKRQEREEKRAGFHRSERSYGHFYRMIPLPQGAQTDQAKADFKDGVLQVRVPVPANKRQARQIPIAS